MGELSNSVQEFVDKQPVFNQRRKIMLPILRGIMHSLCNVTVTGLEYIPHSGPTVIISNHMSFFDPGIGTAVSTERYVVCMSKAEAIKNPLVRFIVALWGNYYIKRGVVDRQALMSTIELIKSGQLLWIAPEGTRNSALSNPKDGVAYIATKANATVVPMSVIGVGNIGKNIRRLRRTPVYVNFGEPFRFTSGRMKRITREIRTRMMHEAMYRIARTIPDKFEAFRGEYRDFSNATTQTLEFTNQPEIMARSSLNIASTV